MKRVVVCGLGAALFAALLVASSVAKDECKKNPNLGKLRHVVLLRFKGDTSKADIKAIEKSFCELPEKIDSIVDLEWGTNVSKEGLDDRFTHCFLVTFEDEKGREKYLPHPAHKAFVKKLLPLVDKAFVVDYVAK